MAVHFVSCHGKFSQWVRRVKNAAPWHPRCNRGRAGVRETCASKSLLYVILFLFCCQFPKLFLYDNMCHFCYRNAIYLNFHLVFQHASKPNNHAIILHVVRSEHIQEENKYLSSNRSRKQKLKLLFSCCKMLLI